MQLAVRAWIFLSTLLVAAGWILSALHKLNPAGYGFFFAFVAAAAFFCRQKISWPRWENFFGFAHKFRRRLKHGAPLIFFGLALMAFAGGALYPHFNGDSNSYRIPRVLQWLGQEQWHWIRAFDLRMNIAGSGFEWLSAPLILFTHTDRFLFLINFASYLMLPGLIFSVFTRMGVRPRVAWWWMWILPSGWCFVFQAGSDVNDSFAAVYALAAVDFALRSHEKKCASDLWLSMLATALLTNTKQTNIPLAALWLVAVWPGMRLLFARPAMMLAIMPLCLLISIAPVTIFNLQHTGSWTGIPEKITPESFMLHKNHLNSPLWGIGGNIFSISAQNLEPPFFPWVGRWNGMMGRFLETSFGKHFTCFESFGDLKFSVSEENAGLGLDICLLTIFSFFSARHFRPSCRPQASAGGQLLWWLRLMPWLLLPIFMAQVGSSQSARYLAPYYIFLFPIMLTGSGCAALVRRRWWQIVALSTMLITAALMLIAPSRPLLPMQTVTGALQSANPGSKFLERIDYAYARRSIIGTQRDWFKKDLPPSATPVGYATTCGEDEPALWMPFGRRDVERVLPEDTAAQLRGRAILYVVVEKDFLQLENKTIEQWMDQYPGKLLCTLAFSNSYGNPPDYLYLVHLSQ